MTFEHRLKEELIRNANQYHTDNFDYKRYKSPRFVKRLINASKRLLYNKISLALCFQNTWVFETFFLRGLTSYIDKLESLYSKLQDEASRSLLLNLISYRILGHVKVKLPYHRGTYWDEVEELNQSKDPNSHVQVENDAERIYYLYDLAQFGYDVKLFYTAQGIHRCFIRQHYCYTIDINHSIEASPGDTVLDLGGCYGDTALYFASKVGSNGKVYSFEFIPGNIELFRQNIALNNLEQRVSLINRPVWNESGKKVYYTDKGSGSAVSFSEFQGADGNSETICIDDFVNEHSVEAIDFIKTDIEGAEPYALNGAVNTLKKFKPKLAISIYHGMDDFVNIIQQIDQLDLGYRFYLGHASIHSEETVLFCTI